MIPSSALPYAMLAAGVLGVVIGMIIFAVIDRRVAAQERAKTLIEEFEEEIERQTVEPDQVGSFTNLRVPVNVIVERCDAARAARILREHTSPQPLSEAAE